MNLQYGVCVFLFRIFNGKTRPGLRTLFSSRDDLFDLLLFLKQPEGEARNNRYIHYYRNKF